jgi:signal transduction histidine kinase
VNDEVARLGRTLNSLLSRLQEAAEREQRLLDDASHELRTPLSILKAALDLTLSREREPAELLAALHSASEETDRLARLAEDLLVLSRSRAAGLRIHRMSTPLRDLVGRACAGHQTRAREYGARIEWQAPAADVQVDPMRLRQALDNLLDNAIRHGQGTGGLIRVDAHVSGGVVTITAENSGAGFASDLLPRAFEPFVRGHGGAAAEHGAGLGLAIVQAVAKVHGGTAVAENIPGRGPGHDDPGPRSRPGGPGGHAGLTRTGMKGHGPRAGPARPAVHGLFICPPVEPGPCPAAPIVSALAGSARPRAWPG